VRTKALANYVLIGKLSQGAGQAADPLLALIELLEPVIEKAHGKNVGSLPRFAGTLAILDHDVRSMELVHELGGSQTNSAKAVLAAIRRGAKGLLTQASALRLPMNAGARIAAVRKLSESDSFGPDALRQWRTALLGLMTAFGVRRITTIEHVGGRIRTTHLSAWNTESERIQIVINDLNNEDQERKRLASNELIKMGHRAVPFVLAALAKYQVSGGVFVPVSS
jgi:hypothetical protein